MDKKWLKEFLLLYKKEIGLPFTFLTIAGEMNEELVKLAKEAGCISVWFGIEAGNEKIRNLLLKKYVTDKSIYETASLLNSYKIPFGTYNMVGVPGETVETIFETIDMNIKIKADYPGCTIFQPYPKTKIFDYCMKNMFIKEDYNPDYLFIGKIKQDINLFSFIVKHKNNYEIVYEDKSVGILKVK